MAAPRGKKETSYKKINGKVVRPIRYIGSFGDYMAGTIDGDILTRDGKPIPYSQIIGDKKNSPN